MKLLFTRLSRDSDYLRPSYQTPSVVFSLSVRNEIAHHYKTTKL